MSQINKEIINQIIEQVDIVEEVQKDIALTRQGANFVGLCPFHDDNNPSFVVSPKKKICHCFVCKVGGNVIGYRQKKNKISFYESVRLLAEQIGVKLEAQKTIKMDPLHHVNEEVANFYNQTLLLTSQARPAKEYLNQRNIKEDLITRHKLGYAGKDLNLKKYLEEKINQDHVFSLLDINNSDIFNSFGKEKLLNRLIIPLQDDQDRFIGFGARTITDEPVAKYLNTSDTRVFKKSNYLYNFNNAKNNLDAGKLILVEGYFDVFAYERAGYYNVAALMGTNFSTEHIRLLKRYKVREIILSLDNDEAGRKATIKNINILAKSGIKVSVVILPNGKDIDECVNEGINVDKLLENVQSSLLYVVNYIEIPNYNRENLESYLREVFLHIRDKNDYLSIKSHLIEKTKLSENDLEEFLSNMNLLKKTDSLKETTLEWSPDYSDPEFKNTITNSFEDQKIVLKMCFSRKGFLQVEEHMMENYPLITDPELIKIYQTIGQFFQDNPATEQINISDLCDFLESDYFQLLVNINRIKTDNISIEKIQKPHINKQLTSLFKE